jgi:DNA-directed RNA polymerase subunit M/transcription elongation factor TFIIS
MSRKGACRKCGKQDRKAVDDRSGGSSSSNQRSNANGNQTANEGNGGNNSNNNYRNGANNRNGSGGKFVPQSERTCYQCYKKTMMMIYRHESKEGDQLIGTHRMNMTMLMLMLIMHNIITFICET